MRHLLSLIAVSAIAISTAAAKAELGDQLFELLRNEGASADYFGTSVAISGTIAIVGAKRNDDNGDDSGSAYLFDIASGRQITKLLPEDGAEGDFFGSHVAISGSTAIVGAYRDENWSGSAYLFDARLCLKNGQFADVHDNGPAGGGAIMEDRTDATTRING